MCGCDYEKMRLEINCDGDKTPLKLNVVHEMLHFFIISMGMIIVIIL